MVLAMLPARGKTVRSDLEGVEGEGAKGGHSLPGEEKDELYESW